MEIKATFNRNGNETLRVSHVFFYLFTHINGNTNKLRERENTSLDIKEIEK